PAPGIVIDQRGRCRFPIAAGQAPGLLHPLGMHTDNGTDRLALRRHTGVAQLAGASALAHPLSRKLALSIGISDVDVATKADDVSKTECVEKDEQLLIGEAAIGENGDTAAGR